MSLAMLHKSYFVNCCFCFIFISTSLTDPVKCIQTVYKLVGKPDYAEVTDSSVPFLTQSFFTCGSNEDCTKVAKVKGNNEFKEVVGQQAVKEDAVVYEKVSIPSTEGKHPFASTAVKLLQARIVTTKATCLG